MNKIHTLSVNTIRVLSADAIQKANSGHPGLPLGAAPMAYELWANHMNHNPADPDWPNRDRFILSGGHGSMLLYSLLHLFKYDNLSIDDIKNFRQLGSVTPGHPEYGCTVGVEATTGPLGAGMAMAVGMAMAEAHLAAVFNKENYPVVESKTIGLAQHNPYTWLIREDAFKVVEEIRAGRKFMDQALNEWILSLDQEQMRTFVDTFYRVVQASETDNLIDFTANWFQSIQKIGAALKEVDKETADVIVQIMRALFEVVSAHAREHVKNRREQQRERFEEGMAQLEMHFRKDR